MNNLFIYRCFKNQKKGQHFGLSRHKYRVGHFVTPSGDPTFDIDQAYVFREGEYQLTDSYETFCLEDYFELVPVSIKVTEIR